MHVGTKVQGLVPPRLFGRSVYMTPCRRLTLSVVAFCTALWMCALQTARKEAVSFGFERTAGPMSALYAYSVAFARLLTPRS